MRIHEGFTRRVRIIGKPGDTKGYSLHVQDVDTGEPIANVFAADIHSTATSDSWVELTYYEANETGNIVLGHDGNPIEKTIRLPDPEIDVTAYYHSSEAWE